MSNTMNQDDDRRFSILYGKIEIVNYQHHAYEAEIQLEICISGQK